MKRDLTIYKNPEQDGHIPLKERSPFSIVFVGYPGTGHQPTFEKMLCGFFTDVDKICLRGGDSDITMPLVGTSKQRPEFRKMGRKF